MRVLLIDDHEIVRRGLIQVLTEEYPEVVFGEASHAKQAREKLTREKWDLVLLDINLPGGNGLDLLKESRASRPPPKVLILTSYPEDDFAVRSFQIGADGYLTKASLAEEILLAIRRVLAGGKYVSRSLAEKLAAQIGSGIKGEPHDLLSLRELQVLRMVASGRTIKSIAAELSLSEKTISTYRSRLSKKLGLSTNVALARYAMKHGLTD